MTRDLWPAVRLRRKAKSKTARSTVPGSRLTVDTDLVLSIPQAIDLAKACVALGSWGGIVECYVLVMAMCGLRPNEAVGLAWEDLEFPADGGTGWLTVRRSRRRVASRWLDPEEDPEWGPLQDRDLAVSRRVPVNRVLVAKLIGHRKRYGQDLSGLVFHRNGHPFDLSVIRPRRLAASPDGDVPAPQRPASRRPPPAETVTAATPRPPSRRLLVVCAPVSTPLSASAGRDIRPCRSSSTSTRASRPGEKTKELPYSSRPSPNQSLLQPLEPLLVPVVADPHRPVAKPQRPGEVRLAA